LSGGGAIGTEKDTEEKEKEEMQATQIGRNDRRAISANNHFVLRAELDPEKRAGESEQPTPTAKGGHCHNKTPPAFRSEWKNYVFTAKEELGKNGWGKKEKRN